MLGLHGATGELPDQLAMSCAARQAASVLQPGALAVDAARAVVNADLVGHDAKGDRRRPGRRRPAERGVIMDGSDRNHRDQ